MKQRKEINRSRIWWFDKPKTEQDWVIWFANQYEGKDKDIINYSESDIMFLSELVNDRYAYPEQYQGEYDLIIEELFK